ncbi:MAG: glycosyltransferase [Cyanobacteriota bacterium]|nr:glycosyltransferase [Cyanobacteriota bacterium]
MRVLHVIPSISPLRGGPTVAALEMAAAQRAQGLDVRLLSTDDHGPGVLPELPAGAWIEHQGVPVWLCRRWRAPQRHLRDWALAPALPLRLQQQLARTDLLHVHALFAFPSSAAMLLARRAGVPYVVSTIGQLCHWSLSQSARRKRLMLALMERANLGAAAALHVTTAAEAQQTAALGLPAPCLAIPLGVQLPPLLPGRPTDAAGPRRLLFLSRLHPKKQLEVLLSALALLRQQQPALAWTLQIAGQGEPAYEASLRDLIGRLGLEAQCQWLGFVEGEAKWRLLAAADWFVLPSALENFGIAVIEALAAGTPVLISPEVALAPEVVAAGAGVVCQADPEALAARLAALLQQQDPSLRSRARALAAERFAWPAIARRFASAYSALAR